MKAKGDTSNKRQGNWKRIRLVLVVTGVICVLWSLSSKNMTKRKPTFTTTAFFENLTETKAFVLSDLHENDVVVYHVGLQAGWADVWIDNTRGERMTEPSGSGETRLVIPEQGDYILLVAGDHADASVGLTIYAEE